MLALQRRQFLLPLCEPRLASKLIDARVDGDAEHDAVPAWQRRGVPKRTADDRRPGISWIAADDPAGEALDDQRGPFRSRRLHAAPPAGHMASAISRLA